MDSASLELLSRLTEADGVSGDESEIRRIFIEELKDRAELIRDRMGGLIFRREGEAKSPRVMLAAHTDEIGFMVRTVTKSGYLRFVTVGGWWNHIIPGLRVRVRTPGGKLNGVIGCKSPHLLKEKEKNKILKLDDMAVDVGASSKEEAEAMGIAPGQWIAPYSPFFTMNGGAILGGKAFDDRAGCAMVIETLKGVDRFPCTLFGAATVQEEVGLRGARTAATVVDPDVAVILEGAPASDTYGKNGDDDQSVLGKGVQIRFFDPTMIANPGLRQFMVSVAEDEGIPYQILVRDKGGTDAGRIHLHGQGVPSVVLAVPVRYAHSGNCLIHADDYANAVRLLQAAVKRLDAATVAGFTA